MSRSLPIMGEVTEPSPAATPPFAQKGFRPFFLLAALAACGIVPVWLLVLFGQLRPSFHGDAATWHAHEMLFGFAVAVIAGFLLTAVGNWTGRETVVGGRLLALAGLWLIGRLAPALPRVAMVADLAFLPVLALILARPLVAARNKKNFVMLGILAALWAANVAMHLDACGVVAAGTGRRGAAVALDVIVLLCLLMGGRVIPMFTRNATGNATITSPPVLDAVTAGAMLAVTLVDVLRPGGTLAAAAAGVTAIATLARLSYWRSSLTLRHPLLWILHAGVAWIAVGMLLRAAPLVGIAIPDSVATHALTVGALGALTLGMMARVALGHTGRPLAPPRAMGLGFTLVTVAALVRVGGPLLAPALYGPALIASGALWTGAFAIYVLAYGPILFRRRVDGRPG